MKYGVCIAVENENEVRIACDCGYDFVEANYQMIAGDNEEKRCMALANIKKYGIPCIAANCFIPGDLKLCGGAADKTKLKAYVERGLELGKQLGVKKVVFGSGGARGIPQGVSYIQAVREIVEFLSEIVSPLFSAYDTELLIEPLGMDECNFIHTVKEAAGIAAMTGSERIGVLADIYHMRTNSDDFSNIIDLKGVLRHAHISYPIMEDQVKRRYPRNISEYNYLGFIRALKTAECDTCSVEATKIDFAVDAPVAMKVFRAVEALED